MHNHSPKFDALISRSALSLNVALSGSIKTDRSLMTSEVAALNAAHLKALAVPLPNGLWALRSIGVKRPACQAADVSHPWAAYGVWTFYWLKGLGSVLANRVTVICILELSRPILSWLLDALQIWAQRLFVPGFLDCNKRGFVCCLPSC